jgi:hypothetical protein
VFAKPSKAVARAKSERILAVLVAIELPGMELYPEELAGMELYPIYPMELPATELPDPVLEGAALDAPLESVSVPEKESSVPEETSATDNSVELPFS